MPSQFKNVEIADTGFLTLPAGTSQERPSSPESGMIRFNTDTGETEWYDSSRSDWFALRDTDQFVKANTDAELVVNGTFDADTSGWTALSGGAIEVENGKLKITETTGANDAYAVNSDAIPTEVGENYVISWEFSKGTNTSFDIRFGSGGQQTLNYRANQGQEFTEDGRYTFEFTATATELWLSFIVNQPNTFGFIDNVSVRKASNNTIVDTEINSVPYRIHYIPFAQRSNQNQITFNQDMQQATPNAPDQLFDFGRGRGITSQVSSEFTAHTGHNGIWPHYAVVKLSNTGVIATKLKWIKHGNAAGNVDFYGSNDDITDQNFTELSRYDFLGRGHFGGQNSENDGVIKEAEFNSARNSYKWYLLVVRDGDPTPLSAPSVGALNPYAMYGAAYFGNDDLEITTGGEVDYLIAAGGGGGGGRTGGGGGAGGLLMGYRKVLAQAYNVVIGDGGQGGVGSNERGFNGDNSSIFGLTAIGGGGGSNDGNGPGKPGGSGGGATYNENSGSNVAGQGNPGGASSGLFTSPRTSAPASGGGGAGKPGSVAIFSKSGDGGTGMPSTISGSLNFYSGGGGGGFWVDDGTLEGEAGIGGLGGGGNGSVGVNPGQSGNANTGGGGGGSGGDDAGSSFGGAGGSGIVIVRYKRDPDAVYSQPDRTIPSTLPNNFNVIQDGLVLNLDAGNPVSYPGSGSTWRDIAKGTNGIIDSANFKTENSGYFSFDGVADYVTGKPNLSTLNGSTIFIWYKSTVDHTSHRGPFAIFVGSEFIFMETRNNRNYFQVATETKSKNIQASSSQEFLINGEWHHIAIARDDGGNITSYIDGNLISATQNDIYGSWSSPGTSYWLGVQADGGGVYTYHECDVGVFSAYSKNLSQQEVRHNFNVTRWRFGI